MGTRVLAMRRRASLETSRMSGSILTPEQNADYLRDGNVTVR